MNKIVEMVFGSHLYGLAGPNSDRDYKGIFLPSVKDVLCCTVKATAHDNTKLAEHTKNTANDRDMEMYSLQYFFALAEEGQTVAIDMLHAPAQAILATSDIWEVLVAQRSMFYSKNIAASIRYARAQAAKYGIKGSRLSAAKAVLNAFKSVDRNSRVNSKRDILPINEHCQWVREDDDVEYYQVCGKLLNPRAFVREYLPVLERFIEEYGSRARLAELNQGVDWKAVSHAFRIAYQIRAILRNGGFTYPLAETAYLRELKTGNLHFTNEVSPRLETLIEEVEALAKVTALPTEVNRTATRNLLYKLLRAAYKF